MKTKGFPGCLVAAVAALLLLQGCAGAALTAGGVAGGAGVDHTLSGITFKTFTASVPNLRAATLKALSRMQIEVKVNQEEPYGWRIDGVAADRTIEIELERLTPATTRMKVVTNKGSIFKDSATSTEIILQTVERLNDPPPPPPKRPPPKRKKQT